MRAKPGGRVRSSSPRGGSVQVDVAVGEMELGVVAGGADEEDRFDGHGQHRASTPYRQAALRQCLDVGDTFEGLAQPVEGPRFGHEVDHAVVVGAQGLFGMGRNDHGRDGWITAAEQGEAVASAEVEVEQQDVGRPGGEQGAGGGERGRQLEGGRRQDLADHPRQTARDHRFVFDDGDPHGASTAGNRSSARQTRPTWVWRNDQSSPQASRNLAST